MVLQSPDQRSPARTQSSCKGPVHINVPISEPFFKLPVNELPVVRKIVRYCGLNPYDKDYSPLIERLNRYRRRMAVAGQMNLIYLFDRTCARILSRHFRLVLRTYSQPDSARMGNTEH